MPAPIRTREGGGCTSTGTPSVPSPPSDAAAGSEARNPNAFPMSMHSEVPLARRWPITLAVMDDIIDDTVRLAQEHGQRWFLMAYADRAPWVDETGRSVFVDGEIALMMASRRLVRERPDLRQPLWERLDGQDHSALISRWLDSAGALREPQTGLLGSEFTRDGQMRWAGRWCSSSSRRR